MATNTQQQSGGYSLTRNTPCTDEARDQKAAARDVKGNIVAFYKLIDASSKFDWNGRYCGGTSVPSIPGAPITEIRGNILTIVLDRELKDNTIKALSDTRGHLIHIDPALPEDKHSFTATIKSVEIKGKVITFELILSNPDHIEDGDVITYFYHSATGNLEYINGEKVPDQGPMPVKNSGPDLPIVIPSVVKPTITKPVFLGTINDIALNINEVSAGSLNISPYFSTGDTPTAYTLVNNPPDMDIANDGFITITPILYPISFADIYIEAINSGGKTETNRFKLTIR